MASEYDYDVVIIGAGPGGYVAAIRASQLGLKDNDEGNDPYGAQTGYEPVDGNEIEPLGDDRQDEEDDEPEKHVHGTGATHQGEQTV